MTNEQPAWVASAGVSTAASRLIVSATDIAESVDQCPRFTWMKIHRDKHPQDWSLRKTQYKIPVVVLSDLVQDALNYADADEPKKLEQWLKAHHRFRTGHTLLREYLLHAVPAILDAQAEIEAEVGKLNLVATTASQSYKGARELNAWGHVFHQSSSSLYEIHRMRIRSVHKAQTSKDALWSATAAYLLATKIEYSGVKRVRVVEVSGQDGEHHVCFDGTPAEAIENFKKSAAARLQSLTTEHDAHPGRKCSECKIAGVCPELATAEGVTEQNVRGAATRSVSAHELATYERCPSRWLGQNVFYLPTEFEQTEAMTRGNAVHRWIAAAHARNTACRPEDLVRGHGLHPDLLDDEEWALALPYLAQHIAICPLAVQDFSCIAIETDIHRFDPSADLVLAMRPDLIYRTGRQVRIRELKTMEAAPLNGRDEGYSKYLQIPLSLSLLSSGLMEELGCTDGLVELEILTPTESKVWRWSITESGVAATVSMDVDRAIRHWHRDGLWAPRPSADCQSCGVRRWCPERDTYRIQSEQTSGGRRTSSAPTATVAVYDFDDDIPF